MTSLPPDLLEAFSSFQSPRLAVHKIEYLGRKLDFVSLCAIQTVLSLLHVLPCRPNKICDLGGGTGKYAYAWLTNTAHQPKLIVIVDLAETLVYSETLLRREFGDRVQYLTGPAEHPNSSGIVLCPVANIEAIRSLRFDLVTNVGSMQEMSDKWVDWYMEWLDRQPCSYLYSSNYFGQPLDSMHEGHNSWSPRPSPSWRLVKSNITPGPRIGADMLFVRDNAQSELKTPSGRTLQAWLDHLELARCRRDEASYRQALAFAETLPYTPKEAWQVARMLAQVTGATADREYFERLDQQRRDGFEARH